MKPVICLMGPTACGKTPLAVELAQIFPLEIISVDSAMVYRGLDIGTAKPDAATLKIAPHHLIDLYDAKHAYSAGQFVKDAQKAMAQIQARNKIPLLVGGTMLYFNVLQNGIAPLPTAAAEIRSTLQARALQEGWASLHAELMVIDPEAASKIKEGDGQRISRALEVFLQTGQTLTSWQKKYTKREAGLHFYNYALNLSAREILHERITARFDRMLEQGLVDEVKRLYERKDLSDELPAIRAVGYRQVWKFLRGEISFAEMREQAIVATRQLAKRQMTWLRAWPNIQWFISDNPECLNNIAKCIEEVLRTN